LLARRHLSALWRDRLTASDLNASAPAPPAQTLRCEYQDLVIRLHATSLVPGLVLQDQYEGRAHAALAEALLPGWHAEDPTDWASVRRTGRLKGHIGHGFLGIGDPRYVYESVTIRLTRHVPMHHINILGAHSTL
jgi:hypothetical protein